MKQILTSILFLFFNFNQIFSQFSINENEYFEFDINQLFMRILQPGDIFIEIGPTSLSRLNLISQVITSNGILTIYDQLNILSNCPSVIQNNILCLSNGANSNSNQNYNINDSDNNNNNNNITLDSISSITFGLEKVKGKHPSIIKISNLDFRMINETQTIKSLSSLFYIELNDKSKSKQVIDYFISEGEFSFSIFNTYF